MRTYIQTSGRSVFFFLHVAIRNLIRSKYIRQKSNFTKLRCVKFLQVSDFKLLHITIVVLLLYIYAYCCCCAPHTCVLLFCSLRSHYRRGSKPKLHLSPSILLPIRLLNNILSHVQAHVPVCPLLTP